jgi:endonuclease/exonuclease/phosphatase family metal-dependent hydrolase
LGLLVRTWNLYHGRTYPKSGRTYLERMVRLVTLDAPDIVALQEVPLWSLGRLERWSGMQAVWAVTVPNFLGPVARFVSDLDPVRVRFTVAGQANAVLINPHFEVRKHQVYVMNPEVSRWAAITGGRQRRVCQAVEVEGDDRSFLVANLHATNNPDLAKLEVGLAADLLHDAEHVLLCGDFNVPRFTVADFSPPLAGIDQILVRGLELERRPERWPKERRLVNGHLLSDHAPVEAVIAWS